ncbi:MAG TPA: hypothetical protein VMF31_10395 [Solirubrobacterales bacterium]|nr:hypothetical protein [Solirubrobacterales bacterium]
MDQILVADRFNGPIGSGNGGYFSGIAATCLEGPVEVSLRAPVPLDTQLNVEPDGDGVRITSGDTLVATADRSGPVDLEIPPPVDPDTARLASEGYIAPAEGMFSQCFVCGRGRHDSLGVFAGSVPGRDLAASPWTPPDWTADESGLVREEFIWAVLDCPTYFAIYTDEMVTSFLVRQKVEIRRRPRAGELTVVIAWPLGSEGRKRFAGASLLSAEGDVLAVGDALLVETGGRSGIHLSFRSPAPHRS